jgi:hypothetical protein
LKQLQGEQTKRPEAKQEATAFMKKYEKVDLSELTPDVLSQLIAAGELLNGKLKFELSERECIKPDPGSVKTGQNIKLKYTKMS